MKTRIEATGTFFLKGTAGSQAEGTVAYKAGVPSNVLKYIVLVSMVEIGDRVKMSEHTIRNMVSAMKSDLREQLVFEYENNKWEV